METRFYLRRAAQILPLRRAADPKSKHKSSSIFRFSLKRFSPARGYDVSRLSHLVVVDQFHVARSPGGTPQRSPRRKPWETKPLMTRKPRQGRHFGLARTNVGHYRSVARLSIHRRAVYSKSPAEDECCRAVQ